MAKLVFQDPKTGQMRHVTLSFIGGPVSVGRNKSNVVAIKHRSISRYHGRLRFENGEHYYDDLKSSNGSFVNGERVSTSKLEDGAMLRLGDVTLEFSIRKMPTLELLPLEPEPLAAAGVDDGNDESTYTIDLPDHMRREAAEHGDMTFVPGLSGGPSRDLETLKERAIERAQVSRPWENDSSGQDEPDGLEEHTYTADALDLSDFPEDTFEQEPPKGLAALLEQAGVSGVKPDAPEPVAASPALPSPPIPSPPEPKPAPEPTPPKHTPSSGGATLGRIKLRSFKAAKELAKETSAAQASAPTPPAKPEPPAAPAPPEPLAPEPEADSDVSAEFEPFAGTQETGSLPPRGRLGSSANASIGESPEDIVGPATSVLKIDPIAAANAWIKSTAEGDAVSRADVAPAAPEPAPAPTSDAAGGEDVAALKARIQELEMKISELELERDNAREIADVIRRNAARLIEALED